MIKQLPLLTILLSLSLVISFSGCNSFIKESASSNSEKFRPQIHFTPPSAWMNDPNGMVYYDGEYHLFYQHYPDSTVWGPMHWGHAVSKNLVKWEHLPIALYPDSLGYIFSGSAVMDLNNTSGLGSKENPAMVAIFTYHNPITEKTSDTFQYQGIAYSLDKGRTWEKYRNNPVLKNPGIRDFRDPKVSWNKAAGKWIMVLAAGDRVKFYSSPDLLNWTFESDFGQNLGAHGGVWECPDLFPMQVGNQTKWVLFVSINPGGPNGGSATQYFVGDFDGKRFTPVNKEHKWLDYGKDNYAGVTWSNVPEKDGRTLFIGWMSNWQYANVVPTVEWRSAATIARELNLIFENNEYILTSNPVKELDILHSESKKVAVGKISGESEIKLDNDSILSPSEILIHIQLNHPQSSPSQFGITFSNSLNEKIIIGYDTNKKQLFFDRSKSGIINFSKEFPVEISAPCELTNNELKLHLILDEASLEVFAQDGKTVMTNIFFPNEKFQKISAFSNGGDIVIKDFSFTSLKSIW